MSRLDSFIRRVSAQRDCLNMAKDMIADVPGPILELGLGNGRTFDHLRELFPDLARFQRQCYFPNCSHDHEPDCAVYDALERGEVAITRYASYMEMLDELRGAPEDDDGPPE